MSRIAIYFTVAVVLTVLAFQAAPIMGLPTQSVGCTCAAKNSTDPNEAPLANRTIHVKLPCDQEGRETCKKVCIALAISSQQDESAKYRFCDGLSGQFMAWLKIMSSICDEPLVYTGMDIDKPICCKDQVPVDCSKF